MKPRHRQKNTGNVHVAQTGPKHSRIPRVSGVRAVCSGAAGPRSAMALTGDRSHISGVELCVREPLAARRPRDQSSVTVAAARQIFCFDTSYTGSKEKKCCVSIMVMALYCLFAFFTSLRHHLPSVVVLETRPLCAGCSVATPSCDASDELISSVAPTVTRAHRVRWPVFCDPDPPRLKITVCFYCGGGLGGCQWDTQRELVNQTLQAEMITDIRRTRIEQHLFRDC